MIREQNIQVGFLASATSEKRKRWWWFSGFHAVASSKTGCVSSPSSSCLSGMSECRYISSLFLVGVTGPDWEAAVPSQRAASERLCHSPPLLQRAWRLHKHHWMCENRITWELIIALFNHSSKRERKGSLTFSSCYFIQYWETDFIYGFNMVEFYFKPLIRYTWYLSFGFNDW